MRAKAIPNVANVRVKAGDAEPSRRVRVEEWPKELSMDLAWEPNTFKSEDDYTLWLSPTDVEEVHAALDYFNDLGLYGSEVSRATFPLPSLGLKLLGLAVDVHLGHGFVLIRGLDPDAFSPEDNVLVFLGLSSYIGDKRGCQDEDGNMLAHIRDAKMAKVDQEERPVRYSTRASTFHTDTFCDILALQTRRCPAEGGKNILSSSWTVYNKLAKLRPDLVELLAQPIWPFDSRGTFLPSSTRPLLFYHGTRIILNYAREPLLGLASVPRAAALPHLTPLQREALDLLEQLAAESQLTITAEPGDLLFVNNHAVLHSREAFVDAPGQERYLVRLWLRNELLKWKLPRALQDGNSRIYDEGEPEDEKWNIVDVPRVRFRLSERLTS